MRCARHHSTSRARTRLLEVYRASIDQLRETLSSDLQDELATIFQPLEQETASESELRIVQAQLVGWLRRFVPRHSGIAVFPAGLGGRPARGMRKRRALEAATRDEETRPGLYL